MTIAERTYRKPKTEVLHLSLHLLAVLNIADAFFSFWIFKSFGRDEELNPVISAILALDESALLFLTLKIGLSLVLIAYWKMAANIRTGISVLAMVGVIVYCLVFFSISIPLALPAQFM